jgi:hypothetical protein
MTEAVVRPKRVRVECRECMRLVGEHVIGVSSDRDRMAYVAFELERGYVAAGRRTFRYNPQRTERVSLVVSKSGPITAICRCGTRREVVVGAAFAS